MFGIDVEKLAIIGVVALIVVGPQRLPMVARTLGTIIGRAQRYLADVRAEVTREMQLDELRQVRDSVRDAAHDMKSSVSTSLDSTRSDIVSTISGIRDSVTDPPPVMTGGRAISPPSPVKRQKWRRNRVAHQSSTPLWYRHTQRRRTRVLSAAARVARYRVRGNVR